MMAERLEDDITCNFTIGGDNFGLIFLYSLSFSLGLPANLLSLWGLYQLRHSGGRVQLFFLANLLVSDLLQLLTLPLWMVYLRENHKWGFNSIPCNIVSYIFYVNLYSSIGFLCLIALDRYLAIVHPLRSRRVRQGRVAVICGLAIWIFMFFFCMIGLYPSVYSEASHLCLERYPVEVRYASFKIATIIVGFLVPCAILGFTSVCIAIELRKSPSVPDHERHKIVGTLVIITVIFVLVFGPYHIVGGYKFVAFFLTDDRCRLEEALFLCYRICYGFTSLNNLLDPLLYIFICHDARDKLKQLLCCLKENPYTPAIADSSAQSQ